MSLLLLCRSKKRENRDELRCHLDIAQSRIVLLEQKSERVAQQLTARLLETCAPSETTRRPAQYKNEAEARIVAGSLIREQNFLDVLGVLAELCATLLRSGLSSLRDRRGVLSRKKNACPRELAPAVVTLIYCSVVMGGRLPELAALRHACQRRFGEAFVRRASQQHNENLHPLVLAKLTPPSARLVDDYLRVFREQAQRGRSTRQPSLHKEELSITVTQCKHGNDQENGRVGGTTHHQDNNQKRVAVNIPAPPPSPANHLPKRESTDAPVTEQRVQEKENIQNGTTGHSLSMLSPDLPLYTFRPNPDLEIVFDARTKNPVYVLEKLDVGGGTKNASNNGKKARMPFREEESLPPEYRSRLSHFLGSGYDRGHMAPAADFLEDASKLKDTYNLCNVSPQVHSMNQSIWCALEHACRRLCVTGNVNAKRPGEDVFVVTGPLWLPEEPTVGSPTCVDAKCTDRMVRYPVLGTKNGGPDSETFVHVPTHFFKVIAVVKDGSAIRKCACFLVPNAETPPSLPLKNFAIDWKELEILSGLRFFPKLSRDDADGAIILAL